MKGAVIKTSIWNEDTKSIFIQSEKRINFIPGQFMMVGLETNGKLEKRAFSICNTPDEEHVEITFKRFAEGKLSPKLFDLKEGDELIIEGPYGNFRLNFEDKNAVLIAGGTGIAPLMSMIRYNKYHNWPMYLTVFYSAKNPSNILYRQELERYHMEKRIHFIPISQDNSQVPNGFITGRVTNELITSHVKNMTEQSFYLCGPPKMITEIEAELRKSGIEKQRIKTDKW